MTDRRATPYLGTTDLAGSALLIQAERAAKGLPALEGEALARAARLYHHRVEVDRHRREAGRRRTLADGREAQGLGVRVGLAPPTTSAEEEAAPAHAQTTEPNPARVAEARDTLATAVALLAPLDASALLLRAQGLEGRALLEAWGDAHGDTAEGAAALDAVARWDALTKAQRSAVGRRLRGRLQRARDTLEEALAEGGALEALGAQGYRTRRERGGRR